MFRNSSSLSGHPEDSVTASDNDSITSSEDEASRQETAYPSRPSHAYSRSRTYLPNQRHYNNTGPKGVIADAQAFKEARFAHARQSLSSNRGAAVNLAAQPYIENLSNGLGHLPSQAEADEEEDDEVMRQLEEEFEGLDEEGDEDDEFMQQWRLARLQELRGKSVIASNRAAERFGIGRSAKLAYEGLTAVDGEGFLEVVDGSPRSVVVIVFVWDDLVRFSLLFLPPFPTHLS